MRLKDKIALITGAAGGIGRATAVRFAEEGAVLVLSDINEEGARASLAAAGQQGGRGMAVRTDVAKEADILALFARVRQEYGRLDILANIAGGDGYVGDHSKERTRMTLGMTPDQENEIFGGWINGRGNDRMQMLDLYRIIKEMFTGLEYWKMIPSGELVSNGNLCLAEEGRQYLIYTRSSHCRLELPAGQFYSVTMIDPLTGEKTILPDANSDLDNHAWQYRRHLSKNTVFILKRTEGEKNIP